MSSRNYCLILAGGTGQRLWPVSRSSRPKQFLDFFGTGRTLLQQTYDRVSKFIEHDNIYISTNVQYLPLVYEQLPGVDDMHILEEPLRRGTLASVVWGMAMITKQDPQARVLVTPSDQLILQEESYQSDMLEGLDFVGEKGCLMVMGVRASRPETGYGYIQSAQEVGNGFYNVGAFKEKPKREVAEEYLQAGGYYWNAGIFIWDVATAKAAISKFEPEMADIFNSMAERFDTALEQEVVNELFPKCNSISIDYAVMERLGGKEVELNAKPSSVYVLPSDFGWSDLGTWGSLYTHVGKDDNQNAIIGTENVSMIESTNCIVRASGDIKMVLQGLDDYIVADDNGVLLVCKKSQEQRIKAFSETLKN